MKDEEKSTDPPDIIPSSKDVADDMGQKTSVLTHPSTKPRLSLTWVLRNQHTTHNPNPEQPIKFQYKTRRKSVESNREKIQPSSNDVITNQLRLTTNEPVNCAPTRTKSEPSLNTERTREKHRHKKRTSRVAKVEKITQFGYEIHDVDAFLTKVILNAALKPYNTQAKLRIAYL